MEKTWENIEEEKKTTTNLCDQLQEKYHIKTSLGFFHLKKKTPFDNGKRKQSKSKCLVGESHRDIKITKLDGNAQHRKRQTKA